jgi:hypothetical protein
MHRKILIAAAAALVSCGGSSWVDPTTGNFSAQDSAEVMTMLSSGMSAMARQPAQQLPLQNSKALTESVSNQVSCAVSGTVTVNGSVDSSCNSAGTSCSFSGNLSVAFADCVSQNGLKGNGGLYATASGSETTSGSTTTFSVNEHIWGGITVVRMSDGSTIGTCGINVSATVSSDGTTETVHVSGTVCKQAVAQ